MTTISNNSQYLSGEQEDLSDVLIEVSDKMDGVSSTSNSQFKEKILVYKLAEFELNKATFIKIFSKESRSRESYALIATGIEIDGKKLNEYIQTARTEQKSEETQITEVKNAIVSLIHEVLTGYVYGN